MDEVLRRAIEDAELELYIEGFLIDLEYRDEGEREEEDEWILSWSCGP